MFMQDGTPFKERVGVWVIDARGHAPTGMPC